MLDCRLEHTSAVLLSANLQSAIRQSPIDNPNRQSAIGNSSICNPQSSIFSSQLPLVFLSERPHFDRKRGRAGELAPPFERGVEVGRLDDREPADVLFALRKR